MHKDQDLDWNRELLTLHVVYVTTFTFTGACVSLMFTSTEISM